MASTFARGLWTTALAGLALACSDDGPAGPVVPPEGAPNHTVRQGGRFHAPGLRDPEANCVSCHGADLMGGDEGQPSCFACHGRRW